MPKTRRNTATSNLKQLQVDEIDTRRREKISSKVKHSTPNEFIPTNLNEDDILETSPSQNVNIQANKKKSTK